MDVLFYLLIIISVGWLVLYMRRTLISKKYLYSAFFVSFIVVVLSVFIGQVRWQVYPLYLAFFLLLILFWLQLITENQLRQPGRRIAIIFIAIFIGLATVSLFSFPIYAMPEVSGEHLIGTQSYVIEDESRLEQYGSLDYQNRRFKIQLWYPAASIEGYEQVAWIEDGLAVSRALSKDTGLPGFVLDHTVYILSNAYKDAPIKTSLGTLPVVIISHGWRGFRNLHTDFAEELASRGYMVVAIDHSFGSVATVFNDDDIAYLYRDALPNRETTPDFLDYANQLVNTYAGDIKTTIDYLERINDASSGSRYAETMNLNKIGLVGHSTGGGADVTVALEDTRVDAVFGLDPWVEPIREEDIDQGLDIPALFIRSQTWEEGDNNINLLQLMAQRSNPPLLYQVNGTTHYDFTMIYMYSPLTRVIGFTGDLNGRYLNDILETMMLDFFDRHLKNDASDPLDVSVWEEVVIIE